MAIRTHTNGSGNQVFVGSHTDLTAVNDWCRSLLRLAYGPYDGEQQYKKLRFVDAMSLWSNRSGQ